MAHLWDTQWTVNSQYGTAGDWLLSPAPGSEAALKLLEAGGDVDANVGGLLNVDEFGTAILLALFSNARLPDHMIGQYGLTEADQYQYHGNNFGIAGNEEPLGSFLFMLRRAPLTAYTAKLAEHYASLALQTLVRQGRCSAFSIKAEVLNAPGRINMLIEALDTNEGRRLYSADLYSLR